MVWGGRPDDPEATTLHRESVRLAFVAALQHLTPPQRAAVVLFDVLALQAERGRRAARHLGRRRQQQPAAGPGAPGQARPRGRRQAAELDDARKRALLAEYVDAFERYDVPRIVRLLSADAVWEMPPFTGWYSGAEQIGALIEANCPAEQAGDQILVEVSANGGPAWALYMRDPSDGVHRAFQLQVPTVGADGVTHVAAFFDTALFARFGLPDELPPGAPRAGAGAASRDGRRHAPPSSLEGVRAADLLAVPQHARTPRSPTPSASS